MSERGSFISENRSFIYEIGGQGRSSMKTGRSSANKRAFISEKGSFICKNEGVHV